MNKRPFFRDEDTIRHEVFFMSLAYVDAFENLCEEYRRLEFKYQIRNTP